MHNNRHASCIMHQALCIMHHAWPKENKEIKTISKLKTTSEMKTTSKKRTTSFWRLCPARAYTALVVLVFFKPSLSEYYFASLLKIAYFDGQQLPILEVCHIAIFSLVPVPTIQDCMLICKTGKGMANYQNDSFILLLPETLLVYYMGLYCIVKHMIAL